MNDLKHAIARRLVYVHNDWQPVLIDALSELEDTYLHFLETADNYIPDKHGFLNAFQRLPMSKTRYILFGQDPYPRRESAIGEAFIDGSVHSLWAPTGLSKEVNRATSLRNIMKMLLLAHELVNPDKISQATIARIDKSGLIQTIFDLRDNFVANGVLLLNTALVYSGKKDTAYHTSQWKPFVRSILRVLSPQTELILLGNFAVRYVGSLPEARYFEKAIFEHPFNISFVYSSKVQNFFKPMNLIYKR